AVESDRIRKPRRQRCDRLEDAAHERLLGSVIAESQSFTVLNRLRRAEKDRSGKCRVNPAAESHCLNGEENVLNEEIRFNVAAERAGPAERERWELVLRGVSGLAPFLD